VRKSFSQFLGASQELLTGLQLSFRLKYKSESVFNKSFWRNCCRHHLAFAFNTMRNLSIVLVLGLASLGVGNAVSDAAEVITNGNFETGIGIPNWTLTTSVTGIPGSSYPSIFEHSSDGNYCPTTGCSGLGLLVKPATAANGPDYNHNNIVDGADYVLWRKDPTNAAFGGDPGGYNTWRANFGTNTNRQVNLTLEHDPVTVGTSTTARTFTFTGYEYWGNGDGSDPTTGYSGGATPTLNAQSPSGAVPSPTQSVFQIDFLNAFSNVLSTATLDLRTDGQVNDAVWHPHSLAVADPFLGSSSTTSTSKIRVRVALNNMVANYGYQDVLVDNFSLFNSGSNPTLDRLASTNGNLDISGAPVGWTVVTAAHDNPERNPPRTPPTSIQFASPSINPNSNHTPGGNWGVWIRPFVNTTDPPYAGDPALNVDGYITQTVAGVAGNSYTFSAWAAWEQNYCGGLANSGTSTFMKMEFLNGSNNVIGSPVLLDLYQAGMRNSPNAPIQASDWQQWTMPTTIAPAGTANIRVSVGGLAMFNSGANPQSAFFDDLSLVIPGSGAGNLLAGTVPEPTALCLAFIAIAGLGIYRRRPL
jgi:hypothetical protein